MGALDTIYRVFMLILPYAICFAAYVWIGKKAWLVPQKVSKYIALFIIAAGVGYALYRLIGSVKSFGTSDNFEYIVIIVTVALLALASIVMTIGQPEGENRKNTEQPATKEEGKKDGLTS